MALLKGHDGVVNSVSFTNDSKLLASVSDDKSVRLWDLRCLKIIKTFNTHSRLVLAVEFSKNSKILASGSWDNTIKLYNVERLQEISTIQGHS